MKKDSFAVRLTPTKGELAYLKGILLEEFEDTNDLAPNCFTADPRFLPVKQWIDEGKIENALKASGYNVEDARTLLIKDNPSADLYRKQPSQRQGRSGLQP